MFCQIRGDDGEGVTAARAARLEALGFVWTPGHTGGAPREEEKLARLAAYNAAHGDCNVPMRWAEDPRLGEWVKNQRKSVGQKSAGGAADGARPRLGPPKYWWHP